MSNDAEENELVFRLLLGGMVLAGGIYIVASGYPIGLLPIGSGIFCCLYGLFQYRKAD